MEIGGKGLVKKEKEEGRREMHVRDTKKKEKRERSGEGDQGEG